ncbi:MAG: tRNA (adenosine(37)-N6)-threonylcarbamoyltransferase complex transferase subunit TsaD [Candidatus Omnitrophica bacterium]|nr:tRNA (adenosine(37)-N6)-threonylcarbamoyltransferase complex transferase subunit TsaD [Candidatus Omnitrophota bacterium]
MNILGIETSCDETAAAVVVDGRDVRSNVVATSLQEHGRFGGIIPEIASRRQIEGIQPVVSSALSRAKVTLKDLDAIAVTKSPGLVGSLLVGLSFARALARACRKPLIEIDHIQAHAYSGFLNFPGHSASGEPSLPAVALVVSGGHSSVFYIKDFMHFQLLGRTRDDAAGEAFDKVARILELGYPGGPAIDRLAQKAGRSEIRFSQAPLKGTFDFSFSGVKTAVLYYTRDHRTLPHFSAAKVAYAFQESVVEALTEKAFQACRVKKVSHLLVGGGVAANSALRRRLKEMSRRLGIAVHIPPLPLCLDNAAMIAGLAYHLKPNVGH